MVLKTSKGHFGTHTSIFAKRPCSLKCRPEQSCKNIEMYINMPGLVNTIHLCTAHTHTRLLSWHLIFLDRLISVMLLFLLLFSLEILFLLFFVENICEQIQAGAYSYSRVLWPFDIEEYHSMYC